MPPALLPTQKVSLHDLIDQARTRSQEPGYNAEHGVLDLGWEDFHGHVDRFLKAVSWLFATHIWTNSHPLFAD
jgi:hypothetical protein